MVTQKQIAELLEARRKGAKLREGMTLEPDSLEVIEKVRKLVDAIIEKPEAFTFINS